MQVSIIIPTCDRPRELAECLRPLQPQLLDHGTVEVLILDDGTSAETCEMVQSTFPWVHWHAGPRRGPALNRNTGAKLARGRWLIFLDDDCLPSPNWLMAYIAGFTHQDALNGCLLGPTLREAMPPSRLWEAPHNPDGKSLISCNMAVSRRLYLELGGFDERYPVAAFEDTEFEARVRSLSLPIRFVSDAVVMHPLRRIRSPQKLTQRWEGKVIYALDHGASPFRILWQLPWHVLRVIQSRFRGGTWTREDWSAAVVFVREWLGVVRCTPNWIRKWSGQPGSQFWTECVSRSGPIRPFGF